MAELENQEQRIVENEVDNTDLITALKELKANSVSKDKYEALEAKNKEILEASMNAWKTDEQLAKEESEALEPRLEYYKKYKDNKFATDLEYWDNLIKLRKATIKEYGADPCVTVNYGLTPEGGKVEAAYGEAETVEEQFSLIEDMIKESDGNSQVFEALLHSALPRK